MLFICRLFLLWETRLEQWPLCQYSQNVFNCVSVRFYVSMPYDACCFICCSLFLFPETIPSGACYMLMRLDDERLSPGREAKRKCRCRDFKTIWAILFFFLFFCSFCIQANQTHKWCRFLVSLMEIICLRQLLLGDESEINTITVIVLLRKKKCFFCQFIC